MGSTGELALAYVKGLQSGNVSAMVKHFVRVLALSKINIYSRRKAAFATPEQGINCGPVHGGERELRTTYLPPFRRAIIDGGALSVMSAYHSYDGVPAVADKHTLSDILRGEWGYKYFVSDSGRFDTIIVYLHNQVMSDAGATDRLCHDFKMCRSVPIDSEAIVNFVSLSLIVRAVLFFSDLLS